MNKKDFQEYLDRWKLVADAEQHEIQNASFELMLKQTFSIWDVGRSLGFSKGDEPPNPMWIKLQLTWKENLA